ncbi:hypothetical protein [Streptomyces sp. RKAG337]|uniref:hypothetical protein n=1 Tax=Streptomyces sp. RKAG337 TaxID=2893404 RepID=UPI0020345503|nr:hypothetical protein [Streptomyces sp. RKAG337]MCM2424672.1 hypothetical protein [Streptomyces sp. RKAG337]
MRHVIRFHRTDRPGRLGRLLGAVGLTLAVALAGVGVSAAPAAATALPIGQCTTSSGVILAVDFSHWGGPLLRSCGTTPTTGYTLLNQGGWQTTGTGHDGPAFICRIGYSGYQGGTRYPTPSQDSCVLTPPASAYWSYWHADPGRNTWSYSQLGAMSYHPVAGSVDLWIFGGTDIGGTQGRPTFSPDSVRAHNTSPAGTATKPPAPSGGQAPPATQPAGRPSNGGGGGTTTAPGGAPSGAPASGAPGSPAAGTPTDPATSAGTAAPTGPPSPGATPSGRAPRMVDAEPTAAAGHSTGSVVPGVITGALVVLLGGTTVIVARRRRRAR